MFKAMSLEDDFFHIRDPLWEMISTARSASDVDVMLLEATPNK